MIIKPHKNIYCQNPPGFSLVEVLVALVLFSFGLTALIRTHHVAASTLQSVRDRYTALLIAQECIEKAKNSDVLMNTVTQNGIQYAIIYDIQHKTNTTSILTVNVQWKNKQLSLVNHIYPMMK
ncbi:MAG: prepilin-type N-terminal cleavage/methylation domain-containing protein [Candidatus Magnetomorum sp.]|nr:prepilin-type N-terminal cleavage/methylation domain-containing protein [Candidatus Magnetomorum sp.]